MAKRITYHEMNDRDNILRLREVLDTLPPFAKEYFRAAEATTSTRTRIAYAYDVRVFFQFEGARAADQRGAGAQAEDVGAQELLHFLLPA